MWDDWKTNSTIWFVVDYILVVCRVTLKRITV